MTESVAQNDGVGAQNDGVGADHCIGQVRRCKTISCRFPSVGNALRGVPRRAGKVHFRGSPNATEGVRYRHAFIADSAVYCFTAPCQGIALPGCRVFRRRAGPLDRKAKSSSFPGLRSTVKVISSS